MSMSIMLLYLRKMLQKHNEGSASRTCPGSWVCRNCTKQTMRNKEHRHESIRSATIWMPAGCYT
jgi:hypothetical protein